MAATTRTIAAPHPSHRPRARHRSRVVRTNALEIADVVRVATDGGVVLAGYVASDLVAQASESRTATRDADECRSDDECRVPAAPQGLDVIRLNRYAAFGWFDGCISHVFIRWLDASSLEWTNDAVLRCFEQVAVDMALFSPCWCALFLISMEAMMMDTRLPLRASVSARLKGEFNDLLAGNLAFWIPANAAVFGAVPVDYRVATFSAINFAYTVALSLWAEGEKEKSEDDVEERAVEPAREKEVVEDVVEKI